MGAATCAVAADLSGRGVSTSRAERTYASECGQCERQRFAGACGGHSDDVVPRRRRRPHHRLHRCGRAEACRIQRVDYLRRSSGLSRLKPPRWQGTEHVSRHTWTPLSSPTVKRAMYEGYEVVRGLGHIPTWGMARRAASGQVQVRCHDGPPQCGECSTPSRQQACWPPWRTYWHRPLSLHAPPLHFHAASASWGKYGSRAQPHTRRKPRAAAMRLRRCFSRRLTLGYLSSPTTQEKATLGFVLGTIRTTHTVLPPTSVGCRCRYGINAPRSFAIWIRRWSSGWSLASLASARARSALFLALRFSLRRASRAAGPVPMATRSSRSAAIVPGQNRCDGSSTSTGLSKATLSTREVP
jgi:hypothetical protein